MNRKIIFALLVLALATSAAFAAQASQMEITSPDKLKNGDSFNLTLTAKDGTPIADQMVDIIVTAQSGEKNHINFTTDKDGKLGFGIAGVSPGKYTFNCTFNGTNDFNTCNQAKEVTIVA